MTRSHKIEICIAIFVAVLLAGSALALIRWQRQRTILLRGAVLIEDPDHRQQQPIPGVVVSAGELATADVTSDSSGFFALPLRKPIRRGNPIVLSFRHKQYRPLEVKEFVGDKLYVIDLVPVAAKTATDNHPTVKVAQVRIRYTVKNQTELNVGGAVKTFELENQGNVPCKGQRVCSPDGRWKAAVGSTTLDAGVGNQFRNVRASCIAGPCPFTKIESPDPEQDGRMITIKAMVWSDTATFLVEAEVVHPMMSDLVRNSSPVIFGDSLNFTLPPAAEGVSLQADLNGESIVFPLGPALILSWADCNVRANPDQTRVYRCTLKPEYRWSHSTT